MDDRLDRFRRENLRQPGFAPRLGDVEFVASRLRSGTRRRLLPDGDDAIDARIFFKNSKEMLAEKGRRTDDGNDTRRRATGGLRGGRHGGAG